MRRHANTRRWLIGGYAGTLVVTAAWLGCNLVPQTLPPDQGSGDDGTLGGGGSGSSGSSEQPSGSSGAGFQVPGDASTTSYEGGGPQVAAGDAGVGEGEAGTTWYSADASGINEGADGGVSPPDAGADAPVDGAGGGFADGGSPEASEPADADATE